MSKDSEPESRPISVSELLARSQADGATPTTRRDGRGRRRAGRDGSLSVSELTGEIPKITDAPASRSSRTRPSPAESGPVPEAPTTTPAPAPKTSGAPAPKTSGAPAPKTSGAPAPKASGAPEAKTSEAPGPGVTAPEATGVTEPTEAEAQAAAEPETPTDAAPSTAPETEAPAEPTADERSRADASGVPFPRSSDPTPRRAADDRPIPDFWGSGAGRRSTGGRTASGMPGFGDVPLATRDFSADAVGRRLAGQSHDAGSARAETVDEESANAVTGIIPVVDGPEADTDLTVVESDDVDTYVLAEVEGAETDVRERSDTGFSEVMDFDDYRNFADVEAEGDPAAEAASKGSRGLGGLARKLFGRKKTGPKADEAGSTVSRAASAKAAASAPGAEVPSSTSTAQAAGETAERGDNPTEIIEPVATDEVGAPEPSETDETQAWQASAQWYDTEAWAAPVVDEDEPQPADDADGVQPADETPAEVGADSSDTAAPAAAADVHESPAEDAESPAEAGAPAVRLEKDLEPERTVSAEAETGDEDTAAPDAAETNDEHEPSPAMAWLSVIGQAVLGLAVGVGLFWGFTELWRWNPYFALVLAVVVIFGIVTLSHVVRRTKDLPTTLLSLGVGLLVTIGPLVLLAT
ncbi:hypothetical protein [Gordonia paraffinivorans]|uniref:hypothetical protein n=1 Tax=Gordonia paraffinivorans TaxID=175628 RepID=UPI00242AB372|nr:hypothetical protein [Gordonia paraffinivorans]